MTGGSAWDVTFSPVAPLLLIVLAAVIVAGVTLYGLIRGVSGSLLRGIALAVALLALVNPRHVVEQRQPQTDIGVVVVDRSPSQAVGDREALGEEALQRIEQSLTGDPTIELRVVEAGDFSAADEKPDDGTRLIEPLIREAADIPPSRYAGAVVITDGQVHDAATVASGAMPEGPMHVLVNGVRDSFDRRVVIDRVPAYAIVGKPFELAFQVFETGGEPSSRETIPVQLRVDGHVRDEIDVTVGQPGTFKIELDRAGSSIVELVAETADGELSTVNNVTVAAVNGVRDRLRVLLVSGQPHAGERTWRNLLKSDPAVDLVHFTILRPPDKSDFTPIRELALISFPTFELFELKLQEFDLIVFDRYIVRYVLSPLYFRNIRDYVSRGGAVMLAVGPEYAGQRSLYDTPLGEIAPAGPVGGVIERPFRPQLTETGKRHPVTADLDPRAPADSSGWGRWLRQIEVQQSSGEVLMQGVDGLPLLILDRVDEGRIGLLASDQVWLWARDFDGGGPHAELIRRTAHWLMREPALEEERLEAAIEGDRIRVSRHTLADTADDVTVLHPGGRSDELALDSQPDGAFTAYADVTGPGVYRFEDDAFSTYLAIGDVDPLEYRDLRATAEPLSPLVMASGGGVMWLEDGIPNIRRARPGRDMAGRDWIGFRANNAYVVTGLAERPLLPGWLVGCAVVLLLIAAWWRESRPLG